MAKKKIIVEAVASASATLSKDPNRRAMSRRIEAAMVNAINETRAKGITDPVKIKAAMLAARDRVKNESANG